MASGATWRRASSTACAARRWPAPTEAERTRMRGCMKLFPLCGPPFPVPQARLDPLLNQCQRTDSLPMCFAAKLLVNLLAQRQGKQAFGRSMKLHIVCGWQLVKDLHGAVRLPEFGFRLLAGEFRDLFGRL